MVAAILQKKEVLGYSEISSQTRVDIELKR